MFFLGFLISNFSIYYTVCVEDVFVFLSFAFLLPVSYFIGVWMEKHTI